MAPCKTTPDANGNVHVAAAALPITCKLNNPPKGVTISEAEYFAPNSNTGTACTVAADGQSFTFPAAGGLPSGATVNLFVKVIGSYNPATIIPVVENCDNQTILMRITDGKTKFAFATVEVE